MNLGSISKRWKKNHESPATKSERLIRVCPVIAANYGFPYPVPKRSCGRIVVSSGFISSSFLAIFSLSVVGTISENKLRGTISEVKYHRCL